MRIRAFKIGCFLLVVIIPALLCAQEPWAMDEILLGSGKTVRGMIESEASDQVEFMEVRRPPGKPMFLVFHPIKIDSKTKITRISEAERAELAKKLQAYRSRARIETIAAESIPVRRLVEDGIEFRVYGSGPWFRLQTTVEEETARKLAVRLEQAFRAFRQVLPVHPPSEKEKSISPQPVQIIVYGTGAEYKKALAKRGILIENPAFFEPKANRIVAGSTINDLLADRLEARKEHEELKQDLEAMDKEFKAELAEREAALVAEKTPQRERESILKGFTIRWSKEQAEKKNAINQATRFNNDLVEREEEALLRMLYHEALHAYIANFAFPEAEYDVPAWLNEGLAQVFESALIEAGQMRIDAPNPGRLARLKEELKKTDRLALEALLVADPKSFLVHHGTDGSRSDQTYLLAWGVSYYLAFDSPTLGGETMQKYLLKNGAEKTDARERFEAWTKMPIAEFDQKFRAGMTGE